MNDQNRELLFNNAFCERVQTLRKDRGWTAEQMATALGVPPDRYRKYETRSPLPAYLMEQFCLVVDCDMEFLITGRRRVGVSARPSEAGKKRA